MSYHFGCIEIVTNTDTFIDAPYHLPAEAADDGRAPTGAPGGRAGRGDQGQRSYPIGSKVLKRPGPAGGKAALVYTGWSRHRGTPGYLPEKPHT
jgi:kynurenine formamidase